MFILELLWAVALFAFAVLAVGAAVAPRSIPDPLLRLGTGVALALGGQFGIGFVAFVVGSSNRAAALVVAATALAVLVRRRRAAAELVADPLVRRFLGAWLLFAAWSLGLLALIVTYSGGGWAVDWVEHWQRAVFFLERQPLTTRFGAIYTLTARPPLANVLTALWLEGTSRSFAEYQVFITLFGTLVLLPVWIFARRWSTRAGAGSWALLLLLLSPMVAQNITFTWTKLPTTFFILCGLCWVVGPTVGEKPRFTGFAGLCFGLALLTHYSAGPWLVAVGIAVTVVRYHSWPERAFWGEWLRFAASLGAVVVLWFGWSLAHFGLRGTATANTTAAGWTQQSVAQHLVTPALNTLDTIVPFLVRGEPGDGLITQASRLGHLRDVAFNLYQVNLPLGFGFAGLAALAFIAAAAKRRPAAGRAEPETRRFFGVLIPLVTILGASVVTQRDEWGLAHICLQGVVLLGLARVAAALPSLPKPALAVWALLAVLDFVLGIALHFGLESWVFAPLVAPQQDRWAYVHALARSATANANDKWALGFEYVSDRLQAPPTVLALWLALIAAVVIFRLRSAEAPRR